MMKVMKAIGAVLLLLPAVWGVTREELGCEGGQPAIGTPISTLEEAGFQAAIQKLVIDPDVPISITNNARYRLRIVAPRELFFNAFLMLGEFNKDSDSVVLEPTFKLEPISDNIMESSSCLGNVVALTHKDLEPKKEVEGRFSLEQTGQFDIDLTVVVLDESGSESLYYSKYNLTSLEVLPDFPTVTPQLLTDTPTGAPTNATLPDGSTRAPVMAVTKAPVNTPLGNTGDSPQPAPVTTPGSEPTTPVEEPEPAGEPVSEPKGEGDRSQSSAVVSSAVAALLIGSTLLWN